MRSWRRNGDIYLAALVILFGVYFFSGYFTPVRFERERIAVRVEPEWIHVSGLYSYRNSGSLPTWLTLRIPFPIDDEHPTPTEFSLAEADESGRIRAELVPLGRENDVRLRLFFRPGEARWIRLSYRQQTSVPRGCYLLTTTRAWRRPIAQASFRLSMSDSLRLLASNYRLAPVSGRAGAQEFEFSRVDFFPTEDWKFEWRMAGPTRSGNGGAP